jgi:hypothetical protein
MTDLNEKIDPKVLEDIERMLHIWSRMADWLMFAVIFLGTLAIGSTLFISAFAGSIDVLLIKIIAFTATLSLTLITAFNLPSKTSDVRKAWRHLNKALYNFKNNQINSSELIKAYETGENMLGSVDFNYSIPKS